MIATPETPVGTARRRPRAAAPESVAGTRIRDTVESFRVTV
jgi:hypothetical protein